MDNMILALSAKDGGLDKDEGVADENDDTGGNTEENATNNEDEGIAYENGDGASNNEE